MSERVHGRVRFEVHLPDDEDEDVVSVELQFTLSPITGAQLPFVVELSRETAHAQQVLIETLVAKGVFKPMTSAEKVEAVKAALRDRAN